MDDSIIQSFLKSIEGFLGFHFPLSYKKFLIEIIRSRKNDSFQDKIFTFKNSEEGSAMALLTK